MPLLLHLAQKGLRRIPEIYDVMFYYRLIEMFSPHALHSNDLNSYSDKCCSLFCKFFLPQMQSPSPILSASALRAPAEPSQGLLQLKVNHHNAQGKGMKLCSQTEFGRGKKKKRKVAVMWHTQCLIRHPRQRFSHVISLLIPWKCDSQKHTDNSSTSPHLSLALLGFLGSLGNLPRLYIRLKQGR